MYDNHDKPSKWFINTTGPDIRHNLVGPSITKSGRWLPPLRRQPSHVTKELTCESDAGSVCTNTMPP